jgi:hypothetical protein
MAKIFISYSRASKDVVEQLVQDLTDESQETWFDEHLTGGQQWWDNILTEIRECEIFVVALTPNSLESRACQREIKYAKDLQKTLLPVRLSDQVLPDSLPPGLSELQWVDYSRLDKQAFKSLQRTLKLLSLNRQGWTKMTSRQSRYLQPRPFLPSHGSSIRPLRRARQK